MEIGKEGETRGQDEEEAGHFKRRGRGTLRAPSFSYFVHVSLSLVLQVSYLHMHSQLTLSGVRGMGRPVPWRDSKTEALAHEA